MPILRRSWCRSPTRSVVASTRSLALANRLVEQAIGNQILAIPGIELGYCARPGEVDVRILGEPTQLDRADSIITTRAREFDLFHDRREP